jgi:hypothetical protein
MSGGPLQGDGAAWATQTSAALWLSKIAKPLEDPMRALPTLCVLLAAAPALLAQDYAAPRSASVPTRDAERIQVVARAGSLTIEGRQGARSVTVRGTARAASRRALEEVQLIAEQREGTIYIEADIPEHHDENWDDERQALDLTIEVPTDLPLDVSDGSGDLEIRNVAALELTDGSGDAVVEHVGGHLRVHDGSGELRIADVHGDVEVTDGSGELEIHDVHGSVEIGTKGSGELRMTDIAQSVHVGSKGSGSIDAQHVGGDFIVERKGSGDIMYDDVRGRVNVPDPRVRRRGRRSGQ